MRVRRPRGKTLADGPFPTLIEYSGYQVAAPHDLLDSVVKQLTRDSAQPDPAPPPHATALGPPPPPPPSRRWTSCPARAPRPTPSPPPRARPSAPSSHRCSTSPSSAGRCA